MSRSPIVLELFLNPSLCLPSPKPESVILPEDTDLAMTIPKLLMFLRAPRRSPGLSQPSEQCLDRSSKKPRKMRLPSLQLTQNKPFTSSTTALLSTSVSSLAASTPTPVTLRPLAAQELILENLAAGMSLKEARRRARAKLHDECARDISSRNSGTLLSIPPSYTSNIRFRMVSGQG